MNNDESIWTGSETITISTSTNINDYICDTIDLDDITFTTSRDTKRVLVRDNGKIPVDIWAKMFNNGVMEIEDDDPLPF